MIDKPIFVNIEYLNIEIKFNLAGPPREQAQAATVTDARAQAADSVAHFMEEWRHERPDLDPWPVGILARIHRISNRLLRRSEQRLAPLGLTWEAFSVIVTLRRAGPPYELRPTDLLRESLLTSGAITNRIDRVEQLGLVERRSGGPDRRSVPVRLTAIGKRVADEAIANHFLLHEQLLSVLSAAERAQFTSLLAKLLTSLETARDEAADITGKLGKRPALRSAEGKAKQRRSRATQSETGVRIDR